MAVKEKQAKNGRGRRVPEYTELLDPQDSTELRVPKCPDDIHAKIEEFAKMNFGRFRRLITKPEATVLLLAEATRDIKLPSNG